MIRFALLAFVLAACVPSPVPPPTPPDASDAALPPTVDATPAPSPPVELTDASPEASADAAREAAPAPAMPCQAACAVLAGLGCPEGKAPNCVAVLGHLDAARTSATPNGSPVTCKALSHVHTVAEARAQLPAGHSCGL